MAKKPSSEETIADVLQTWWSVSKKLNILTAEEVLKAIELEKARPLGPRTNVLFRLAQRYDYMTKSARIQKLVK